MSGSDTCPEFARLTHADSLEFRRRMVPSPPRMQRYAHHSYIRNQSVRCEAGMPMLWAFIEVLIRRGNRD
jgi:hypothetical protein